MWEVKDRGPYYAAVNGSRVWYANKSPSKEISKLEADVVCYALNSMENVNADDKDLSIQKSCGSAPCFSV